MRIVLGVASHIFHGDSNKDELCLLFSGKFRTVRTHENCSRYSASSFWDWVGSKDRVTSHLSLAESWLIVLSCLVGMEVATF